VRFLVDAQLPKRLSDFLKSKGFDSIQTLELQAANATPDSYIRTLSQTENRIVITKDSDFEDSHLLSKIPPKLVLISTGNIPNSNLILLFSNSLERIVQLLHENDFVELSKTHLIIRG
jgi:predicted nuclease of predicted toxin-antitoxin system